MIFFFDCDDTIWGSEDKDYISSVPSSLTLNSKGNLIREKDNKVFSLRKGVKKAFENIKKSGGRIGIVSDNRKYMVTGALEKFGLIKFVDKKLVLVKLWKGYCPKHRMIVEGLAKNNIPRDNMKVFWFDDKDYANEAKEIQSLFIRVSPSTNFGDLIKDLVDSYKNNGQ